MLIWGRNPLTQIENSCWYTHAMTSTAPTEWRYLKAQWADWIWYDRMKLTVMTNWCHLNTLTFVYLGMAHPLFVFVCVYMRGWGSHPPQAVGFEILSISYWGANLDCFLMPHFSASVHITCSAVSHHLQGNRPGSFLIWRHSKKTAPVSFTALHIWFLPLVIYIGKSSHPNLNNNPAKQVFQTYTSVPCLYEALWDDKND